MNCQINITVYKENVFLFIFTESTEFKLSSHIERVCHTPFQDFEN